MKEGGCEGSVHTCVRGCCTHRAPFRGSVCVCGYLCVLGEGVCVCSLPECSGVDEPAPHVCKQGVEHPCACAQWEK